MTAPARHEASQPTAPRSTTRHRRGVAALSLASLLLAGCQSTAPAPAPPAPGTDPAPTSATEAAPATERPEVAENIAIPARLYDASDSWANGAVEVWRTSDSLWEEAVVVGDDAVVVGVSQEDAIVGHDVQTGEELWRLDGAYLTCFAATETHSLCEIVDWDTGEDTMVSLEHVTGTITGKLDIVGVDDFRQAGSSLLVLTGQTVTRYDVETLTETWTHEGVTRAANADEFDGVVGIREDSDSPAFVAREAATGTELARAPFGDVEILTLEEGWLLWHMDTNVLELIHRDGTVEEIEEPEETVHLWAFAGGAPLPWEEVVASGAHIAEETTMYGFIHGENTLMIQDSDATTTVTRDGETVEVPGLLESWVGFTHSMQYVLQIPTGGPYDLSLLDMWTGEELWSVPAGSSYSVGRTAVAAITEDDGIVVYRPAPSAG